MASVSRVLSSSTTNESTKSSRFQDVFSDGIVGMVYFFRDKANIMIRRPEGSRHPVNRRYCSQFQLPVFITHYIQLNRRSYFKGIDVGMDTITIVENFSFNGQ